MSPLRLILICSLMLPALPVCAQMWTYDDQAVVNPWEVGIEMDFPADTFTFARVRYQNNRRGWGWETDYPDSDINFSLRLSQLTTIKVNRDAQGRFVHVVLDLDDERLFQFPFIYMVEVGNLDLSQREANNLREYLLRGGFLMVDDFWGWWGWENWVAQFEKVFPDTSDYPMVEIPLDHGIFHGVFDLDEVPQVPSINTWNRFRSTTESGDPAYAWGVFDKSGRLMAVILHNTDLGDGWEREGDNFEYFQKFSVAGAYPFGINIVVYAMTH